MISSAFYNKKNLTSQYLGGKIKHYPIKDRSVTLEWYTYVLRANETLYSVAERLFGDGLDHLWTYIADNNPPAHPDNWHPGDTIRLPKVIIRDSDTLKSSYRNV